MVSMKQNLEILKMNAGIYSKEITLGELIQAIERGLEKQLKENKK